MAFRTGTAVASVLAALVLAAPAVAAPKASRLVPFQSCPALLTYAKAHAEPFVTAYGIGKPAPMLTAVAPGAVTPNAIAAAGAATASAPQQGVDYSGTNDQEAGVDEPDTVKTDGNTLFAVYGDTLDAVDISGKSPKLLDTLQLTDGASHELLLSGTHLLVLSRGGYFFEPLPAEPAQMIAPISSTSYLTEIDVSDPSSLSVLQTMTLDGEYVDARMIGSTVRVVTSSSLPIAIPFPAAKTPVAANKATVAHSRISQWLPTYQVGSAQPHAVVQCRNVLRPAAFSGLGMLTVLTIDLSQGLAPIDSTAVMTDGRIVYASPTSLFVASENWGVRPLPATPDQPVADASTHIADFDISDPTKTTYLGSGSVPGYLLDQWSMSDFQGVLRVVSTDSPAYWGTGAATQSYLTTLRPSNGALVQVGQLSGLGQGERVNAVRFVDDTAYVDTFRQIDPLYTIDVSDPTQPRELGSLTIEGYSSYLHPIGDGLLLGVGQDVPTTSQSEPSGSELSLFDVSDPANPTRIAHVSLGAGWSDAESDSHAFLYWPATGLVVVPLNGKAYAYHVSRASGFQLLGALAQPNGDIDRSLVDRSSLVTVSDGGVQANDLSTLAMLGWAPFPQTPVTPVVPINPGGPIVPAAKKA
jgi:uncharacterized secreted protein with C-terminal beta-propeller domain